MVSRLQHADTQFGEFLDWLEATGRSAYTNIVALSDHGHYTIKEPPQSLVEEGTAGVDAISFAVLLEQELGLKPPQAICGVESAFLGDIFGNLITLPRKARDKRRKRSKRMNG